MANTWYSFVVFPFVNYEHWNIEHTKNEEKLHIITKFLPVDCNYWGSVAHKKYATRNEILLQIDRLSMYEIKLFSSCKHSMYTQSTGKKMARDHIKICILWICFILDTFHSISDGIHVHGGTFNVGTNAIIFPKKNASDLFTKKKKKHHRSRDARMENSI